MDKAFIKLQKQINFVKSYYSSLLEKELQLIKIQSPILSRFGDGIQDNLSGYEQAVQVNIKSIPNSIFEVIHSLAKWKRKILGRFNFRPGQGINTDMQALRPEEKLTPIHSVYVDQWDWEMVIFNDERSIEYLKYVVRIIFDTIKKTEQIICSEYGLHPFLPNQIHFIHSEELLQRYPNVDAKTREYKITKELKAVFIIGIGGKLSNGSIHELRAPDYDDWTSPNSEGFYGLNGDIIIWHPILKNICEISSMGIRVNANVLKKQLILSNNKERMSFEWHQELVNNYMPQTIGGGIGQSRLLMLLLQKEHISQVQFSVWPLENYKTINNIL